MNDTSDIQYSIKEALGALDKSISMVERGEITMNDLVNELEGIERECQEALDSCEELDNEIRDLEKD